MAVHEDTGEDARGAKICAYASRRVTLSAPSGWSVAAAVVAGLLLLGAVWWVCVVLLTRWGFSAGMTGAVAWCAGVAAFVGAQGMLPGFIFSRRWQFDPAGREVRRSLVICGIPTRGRRLCGFGEVGKMSIQHVGGEVGLRVELWIGDRVEWLPASRRVRRAIPLVAAMVGKKKQGWDRYGSWT